MSTGPALIAQIRQHRGSAAELPRRLGNADSIGIRTQAGAGLGMLDGPQECWDLQRTLSSTAPKRFEGASSLPWERLRRDFFARRERMLDAEDKPTCSFATYILVARHPS